MGAFDDREQKDAAVKMVGELDAEIVELKQEIAEYVQISDRQSDLLRGVAAALKGPPPELTMWSHHDLPELAAQVTAQVATLRAEKDSPHADAKYWAELQEARLTIRGLLERPPIVFTDDHEVCEQQAAGIRDEATQMEHRANRFIAQLIAERDAALAKLIELHVLANEHWEWRGGGVLAGKLREILAQSPTDALAEHTRAVTPYDTAREPEPREVEVVCICGSTRFRAERDAALAVIERVLNLTGDIGPEARRILTQPAADALAEHDREVKAEVLEEASTWAGRIAEGMGTGSYEHGPSGREADLEMKYRHASQWLDARAAEIRKAT